MSVRGTLRRLTPVGWLAIVLGLGIAAVLLAAAYVGGAR